MMNYRLVKLVVMHGGGEVMYNEEYKSVYIFFLQNNEFLFEINILRFSYDRLRLKL